MWFRGADKLLAYLGEQGIRSGYSPRQDRHRRIGLSRRVFYYIMAKGALPNIPLLLPIIRVKLSLV